MVSFLEGSPPKLDSEPIAYAFGSVSGETSDLLMSVPYSEHSSEAIPFWELYKLHALANEAAVSQFIAQPPFPIADHHMKLYRDAMHTLEDLPAQISHLPQQLVHHDLLIFNLLSIGERITGVLDFDFLAIDAAMMEFAICLNHVLQMTNCSEHMLKAFIEGYAIHRQHSLEEIEALPLLTTVYHIAILHIYIGQHLSGKDIEQNFTYILNQFMARSAWLVQNRDWLQRMLKNAFNPGNSQEARTK